MTNLFSWAKMPIGTPLPFALLWHSNWLGHQDHIDLCLETRSGDNSDDKSLVELGLELPVNLTTIHAKFKQYIRRRYLAYEGVLSSDRGKVGQIDTGFYIRHKENTFSFRGGRVVGAYRCIPKNGDDYVFTALQFAEGTHE